MKLKYILIFILIILLATFVLSLRDLNNDIWDKNNLIKSLNLKKLESSQQKYFSTKYLSNKSKLNKLFGYRIMYICSNESLPILYKLEGSVQKCPDNYTVAVGKYRNAQNETGWGILEVETFPNFPVEMQAYAAGLVEGLLTKVQIHYHYLNTVSQLCKDAKEYCLKLFNYLKLNLEWIESQVMSNPPTDLYWRHVNLTYTQLTGIQDGYGPEKQFYLSRVRFAINPILKIQMAGDFFDLDRVFKKPKTNNYSSNNHCSGFIKVLEGNKDILMAHVTMAGLNTMNRILKLYKFAYDPNNVPGHTLAFSGYPASLASQDDFTITSAGLLSMETTITLGNESIYSNVKPKGELHCWVRSFIANLLASTSKDWMTIFGFHNSGTYNNQWMVLDYKLFKPGEELPKNDLFWILEQIPGTTVSRDMTWFLRKYNYWPSYNIPFLKKISDLGGFTEKANINNWWRWGYSPRAKIFQRDHNKVKDMETLRELMRYNDYKHDEYSKCKCDPPYTADGGISTRSDLNPLNGTWELPDMGFKNEGTIDYKGTNYKLFNKFQFEVIGGPIHGGPSNLPPFNWKNTTIDALHFGQPIIWKFKNFTIEWQTELESIII